MRVHVLIFDGTFARGRKPVEDQKLFVLGRNELVIWVCLYDFVMMVVAMSVVIVVVIIMVIIMVVVVVSAAHSA